MTHKKASLLALLFISLFIFAPAALIYTVDPFQIYHKSLLENVGYSTNELYQHAGWINTLLDDKDENYQSIIIGSSTMSNYTNTMVSQHLPWGKTMNLSVRGSAPLVQAAVAKHALERRPDIKHILWDIHIYYADDADRDDFKSPSAFPYHLYNNTLFDDREYLFNVSSLDSSINLMRGDRTGFSSGVEDNGPFYNELVTQGVFTSYGSYENRKEKLLPELQDGVRSLSVEEISAFKYPSIDQNLLKIIMPLCNKGVDINILFSPSSRFYYASTWFEYVYKQIGMRRYIVEKTSSCENIRVFAFDNLDWITTNLHNYADRIHFDIKINNYILESIAKNENRLTRENIGDYEIKFIENINNYKNKFMVDLERDGSK